MFKGSLCCIFSDTGTRTTHRFITTLQYEAKLFDIPCCKNPCRVPKTYEIAESFSYGVKMKTMTTREWLYICIKCGVPLKYIDREHWELHADVLFEIHEEQRDKEQRKQRRSRKKQRRNR